MSVRVVARIRPLLKNELDKDVIVHAASSGVETDASPTVVKLPNPKNDAELFSYHFNSVYESSATQQELFEKEVSPTVKHLFNGFDVTIFAYGVTGTGKTHTMRGGKSLADRGVIPRLLSSVYRRCKKIEKDSAGATKVEVSMSYYEIYTDRVYDLFQPPEKRTASGLPIRDNHGKTVVCGLTERPCTTLKEFEQLYDQANLNRSTSATKLNAHSSRSHAILCVKITQTTDTCTQVSTASCIDLAGSEDNRRTENNKDRMVESASINKSLFVLAQCVEAIGKKQARIPYRESKMTRILSLGQNNGLTVMILNLAPVRSYQLDTISSLNMASRTKKIEVNEVENEPIFKTTTAPSRSHTNIQGSSINRQPLRPIAMNSAHNVTSDPQKRAEKPIKSFSVYLDRSKASRVMSSTGQTRRPETQKRPLDAAHPPPYRGAKSLKSFDMSRNSKTTGPTWTKASIEELIERRLDEKLAEKALQDQEKSFALPSIPDDLQARLDKLEKRVDQNEDERAEGLQYLFMAKQHVIRGEESSALKMYQLAAPYFPNNAKLTHKMASLEEKIRVKRQQKEPVTNDLSAVPGSANEMAPVIQPRSITQPPKRSRKARYSEDDYHDNVGDYGDEDASDGSLYSKAKSKSKKSSKARVQIFRDESYSVSGDHSPGTSHLLRIINTRDVSQIRLLKGVGAKKAETIVNCLFGGDDIPVHGLDQLEAVKGVGAKGVENMRMGLMA